MATAETPRRTGGRSARVRQSVIDATLQLVRAEGAEAITIPRVAELAGVNATSIYRRWGTRENLILDAAASHATDGVPAPDTGTLLGDVEQYLVAIADYLRSPEGAALVRAMIGAGWTPEMRAERSRYIAESFERFREITDRAIERGELPDGTDARLLLDALLAPLQVRVMNGIEIDADLAPKIARLVIEGARHSD